MEKTGFIQSCKSFRLRGWPQLIFMVITCLTGGYFIVFSTYLMASGPDQILFMLAIAMFGLGCTAVLFGFSHARIQSTEEKLENITTQLDRIIEKIERK